MSLSFSSLALTSGTPTPPNILIIFCPDLWLFLSHMHSHIFFTTKQSTQKLLEFKSEHPLNASYEETSKSCHTTLFKLSVLCFKVPISASDTLKFPI